MSRPELRGNPTFDRLEGELEALVSGALYRDLEPFESRDDVSFSSNDYLGLSRHPGLARAARAAIEASERVSATGSRLLSGHLAAWSTLEEGFATWVGSESSLFFGSGYLANIGTISALAREGDTVYSDSANHASLIDGMRLSGCRKVIFPHLNLGALEEALDGDRDRGGERFIVVESLYSMDGDEAPLNALADLARRYRAGLIVDEAHATGVAGTRGRGLIPASLRTPDLFLVSIHTAGKALAASGAFVAGSSILREFLINRARTFIFSTALPPYMAAQIAAAIRLAANADDRRQRLGANAERLRKGLREAGYDTGPSTSHIVPVILGENQDALRIADRLRDAGFRIRPIRPPSVPEGTSRLRLSVTAIDSIESIDRLVAVLAASRDPR
jgi:8-amino-7-oxononanoate synthase